VSAASFDDAQGSGSSDSESSGSKSDDSEMTSFECHEDLEFEKFSGVDKRAEMEGTNDFRYSDRNSPAFGYIHHRSTPTMEAARCAPSFILYLLHAAPLMRMLPNVPAIFRSAPPSFEPATPAATVSIGGFISLQFSRTFAVVRFLSLFSMFLFERFSKTFSLNRTIFSETFSMSLQVAPYGIRLTLKYHLQLLMN
jgi:hypothetical protein